MVYRNYAPNKQTTCKITLKILLKIGVILFLFKLVDAAQTQASLRPDHKPQ